MLVNARPSLFFFPGKRDRVRMVWEVGWAPGTGSTGAENVAPTGMRSPNLPAGSVVAIPTELSRPE